MENFDALYGPLVFQNTTAQNAARTRINNYLNAHPNQYREAVVTDFLAGKYGTGPGLYCTIRFSGPDSRADADGLWDDITNANLSTLKNGSQIFQTSVVVDDDNQATGTLVHKLSIPTQPDDF